MARHKESKDIVKRDRLSRTELELWPLYSNIQFEPWVQDIIDHQPDEEEDTEIVVQNTTGKEGKGEVQIDGVIYPNVHQACKCLGVSNSLVYKWLRSGKAVRLSEKKPMVIEPIMINGRKFKSIEDASKRLGVSIDVINKWLELKI